MPLQATSGAASYDAFGGGVPVVPAYIEEVFSTYLYTSTGSNQTITNGIDLSTKGGLVWVKGRNAVKDNVLVDTVRGVSNAIVSNTTDAQDFSSGNYVNAFSTTGFGVSGIGAVGGTNNTFATWTFREQPKFFDVVTYTGNGAASRNIAHNLGSVPGCIIVKETNYSGTNWLVYHQSLGNTKEVYLNTTDVSTTTNSWASTTPTSAVFTVNFSGGTGPNGTGSQYVAYLFAHNAGGFGLTGTDNVISCGSYTGNGSADGPSINLGYEAQYVLIKRTDNPASWYCQDNMRGMSQTQTSLLVPNTSDAESAGSLYVSATATGFKINSSFSGFNSSSATYIYIAIRRGPMKVPTSGTSVFSPNIATGNGTSNTLTTNFPVDLSIDQPRAGTGPAYWIDRLRGGTKYIDSSSTTAETTHGSALIGFQSNTTLIDANYGSTTDSYVNWAFRRAPSFFDEVCFTGTNSANQRVAHNLGVAPELIISKSRSTTGSWFVYAQSQGTSKYGELNSNVAFDLFALWGTSAPTSTDFGINSLNIPYNGVTVVAYLFATCAGVSKVGSYTGTATTLQIDCGFTGGARFVLIKRTDSTGAWYVWDTARGIVSGNDPYLLLNSTAAEVTNTDYIDTYNAGFEISSTAPAAINASGGSFIFLAIA